MIYLISAPNLEQYSRGRRGIPAKDLDWGNLVREFKSLLLRHTGWTSGVAVNMSPCHGEDRGFDSRLVRHFAGVVQW